MSSINTNEAMVILEGVDTDLFDKWCNFVENSLMKHDEWPRVYDRWEVKSTDRGVITSSTSSASLVSATKLTMFMRTNGFDHDVPRVNSFRFIPKNIHSVPSEVISIVS